MSQETDDQMHDAEIQSSDEASASEEGIVTRRTISNLSDDPDMTGEELQEKDRSCSPSKCAMLFILVGSIAWIVMDLSIMKTNYTKDCVNGFFDWLEENPILGAFVFILNHVF